MKRSILLFVLSVLLFSVSISNLSYGNQRSFNLLVDGSPTSADIRIINNKPYIDAEAFSKALGISAAWDKTTGSLSVTSTTNDVIIPEIIKNVSPSVVGIVGKYNDITSGDYYPDNIVHGTGLVIKPTGEILTNAHLVKFMQNIVVILANGEGYVAKLKFIDEDSDLAVVKIEKENLKAAKFGTEAEIVTGRTVIAIGTPVSLSLRNSASTGVISGVNRGIDSYYKLIQTDASINPGNSGGPLVSLKGNVIGINSSKFEGDGIEGLGFSIPLGTIQYVLGQFEKYGFVNRPNMGVLFEEDWAAKVGLPSNKGLKISKVELSSPAKAAGLQDGDVLMKIETTSINTVVDYNEVMKSYIPENTIGITIKRGSAIKTIKITLS